MAFRALNSCSRAQLKVGSRYYSSAASTGFVKPAFIDVPRPVLGEYRADVPASVGPKNTPRIAKVTTLANGLRVASLTSSDIAASVGLFVGVGTRNETRSNAGATHFLKYSAFGTNTDMPGYQVVREFETIGASVQASAGREQLAFSAEFPPNKVDEVIPLIRGVLHPKFAYHEVSAQVEVVKEDAERLEADPIASIFELVHRQAYRNRGLGQSLVATKDNLHHMNQEVISKFVDTHYGLDQSVFVGVGFEHEALVKHVEGAFGVKETRKTEITKEASKYVGGEVTVPAGGHTHIVLAFEGASNKGDAKDALALGVLQHVLGSVLNGNVPTQVGSGVTSRLAKLIPNNNAVHTLTAFNFSYTDSGLFGVYAETHDAPSRLVQNISAELNKLRNNLSAEELAKGKAGFKLAVLEKGAQRTSALEFIAAQVFASGKAVTPEEYAAQIDSITAEDVANVAKKVFSSRPTFVAVGDVAQLPTAEEISGTINPKH